MKLKNNKLLVALVALCMLPLATMAQVVRPFTQRTAAETPSRKIYNLKGDFQMIGNSNLTSSTYGDTGNAANNGGRMVYVDIDNDNATKNSSSATLQFPTEAGVDHNCSKIVYAGLYWTGRSVDGMNVYIGGNSSSRTNNSTFNGYRLTITTQYTSISNRQNYSVTTYTFTPIAGGEAIVFTYRSEMNGSDAARNYTHTLTVRKGNGTATTLPGNARWDSGTSHNATFTLNNPYMLKDGVYVNAVKKKHNSTYVNNNFYATIQEGNSLAKNSVKFKHSSESSYTTLTANTADIYYPSNQQYDGIFSGYIEVTDYVRAHGVGEYSVADIALIEGDGGNTGYYGGWGLIVIYENPKMKWRDITIFDGYAYIETETNREKYYDLDVEGFRTAESGDIRIKMGIIAGEGDRGIQGDFFRIKNRAGQFVALSHSGNSTTNFFNSSIPATTPRSPRYTNNYGLDVAMFEVPNSGNSIIGNDQRSTTFRYGTSQDTYVIPMIALAVDAYVPDVRGFITTTSTAQDLSDIKPGDIIDYKLELSNSSNEIIEAVGLTMPIPYTAELVEGSLQYTAHSSMNGQVQAPQHITTPADHINWEVGDMPMPADPNNAPILATISFKLKVTENCDLLVMDECMPKVSVNGQIRGRGASSHQSFEDIEFITGYDETDGCDRIPLYGPLSVDINIADHCPVVAAESKLDGKAFAYCESYEQSIYEAVKAIYPKGTRFYDHIVYSPSGNGVQLATPAVGAIEFTADNDFPDAFANIGTTTYYAIPYGSSTCSWYFTLKIEPCSYWVGSQSTDWGTEANWSKNRVPEDGERIEFATAENNPGHPAQNDLQLDQDRRAGGLVNTTNFKVIIPAGKSLVVDGDVKGYETTPEKLIIKADYTNPNGSFIVTGTPDQTIYASVEMYSRAKKQEGQFTDNDPNSPDFGATESLTHTWQYFGVPVERIELAERGTTMQYPARFWLRQRKEEWNDPSHFYRKWYYMKEEETLESFCGYEISQDDPYIYTFKGKLNTGDKIVYPTRQASKVYAVTTTDDEKIVRHELGQNVLANSYTAAINVRRLDFSPELDQTVYVFNTGNIAQWQDHKGTLVGQDIVAGAYYAIAKNPETPLWTNQIPSMQGFMVKYTDDETVYSTDSKSLRFRYAATEKNSMTQRAPMADEMRGGYLRAIVSSDNSSDAVLMIETPEATEGFDNGWDGMKQLTPQSNLFIETSAGNMQISADETIIGKYITFVAGKDYKYTLNIAKDNLGRYDDLKLVDLATRRVVDLSAEETVYEFTAMAEGKQEKRFLITRGAEVNSDNLTEQDYEMLDAYISNKTLTVSNFTNESGVATIYDMAGKTLLQTAINSGFSEIGTSLPQGVYMVTLRAGNQIETVKFVVE